MTINCVKKSFSPSLNASFRVERVSLAFVCSIALLQRERNELVHFSSSPFLSLGGCGGGGKCGASVLSALPFYAVGLTKACFPAPSRRVRQEGGGDSEVGVTRSFSSRKH